MYKKLDTILLSENIFIFFIFLLTKNIFFVNIINVERQGAFMKRFYKVSDSVFIEIGFIETISKWYADLIDVDLHRIISTNSNYDKTKLIASIVKDNWFTDNLDNFAIFIEDIFKQ